MKLFGWSKSKDPQPQTVLQQVKKTDPWNSSHELDRDTFVEQNMPCKSTGRGVRKQQPGLFGKDDDDVYRHGASAKHKAANGQDVDCDEKLQDTIRFVFSHEQEGLLAIGTFALEQLAAIRDTMDYHRKGPAGDQAVNQEGFESCTDSSDDDEEQPPRRPVSAPDLYTDAESEAAERGSNEDNKLVKPADQSKVITLYRGRGNRSPVPETKPLVLLTGWPPEHRKSQCLPTYVPLGHCTDSAPPPMLPKATVDQECKYSSYFCGLFGSRRKPSRTRSDKLYKHISPKAVAPISKSMLNFGSNGVVPSLGKLAKLWRSSCNRSSAATSAASERKPCKSPRASQDFKGAPPTANGINTNGEVLTTLVTQLLSRRPPGARPGYKCSPEVAEFRRRVAAIMLENNKVNHAPEELLRGHGSGSSRDDGGHWIKTDSEYVVLEM